MTEHDANDAATRAAELRDAAINASASAWRVTGLEARALIKCGEDYERPVALDELAFASSDSLGWGIQGDTARRIAEVWTRAAEAWDAAAAHAQGAQAVAIAELRRQQAAAEEQQEPRETDDARRRQRMEAEDARRRARPESFQIMNGKSYRAARRPTSHHREAAGD